MGHTRPRWSLPTRGEEWTPPRAKFEREGRGRMDGVRPRGRASRKDLGDAQITRAVQSLYEDQLKPYGRILRKRLTEQAAEVGSTVEADLGKLRLRCERVDALTVIDEPGGEWSVCFREPNATAFIDVYSSEDPYPESMWEQAKNYCDSLEGEEATLPGGRYACAMALHERKLTFLRGYTLGQVCHIVQLAISQRKVLGYINGGITPYAASTSMVKDAAAAAQSVESKWHGSAVTTWAEVRSELREILEEAEAAGHGQVALSNIKQVFRAKFQRELCETALGHSKVSELLQDPRMSDICEVRLFQSGYQVLPASPDAKPCKDPTASLSFSPLSEPTPVTLASLAGWLTLQRRGQLSVRNTFVECRSLPEAALDRAASAPPVLRAVGTYPELRPRVLSEAIFGLDEFS